MQFYFFKKIQFVYEKGHGFGKAELLIRRLAQGFCGMNFCLFCQLSTTGIGLQFLGGAS